MADNKKYYWLKLKKDFFKRNDIQIIEAMPNGKDYILFYLKMLVESVDHEGVLKFNDTIPYNETMLATITNTNIDIVRCAMKVFTELKMIDLLEDKTIYMTEVEKMLGTESYWAEQKRKQREIGQCPKNVQLMSNVSKQEIEIDIEKDIEIEKHNIKAKPKKVKYADRVFMLEEEYQKLITQYPKTVIDNKIIDLDLWKGSKGKSTKSDYLTILAWLRREKTNATNNTTNNSKTSYTKSNSFTEYNQRNVDFTEIEKQAQAKIGTETTEDWREKLKKTRETMDNKKLEGK